MQAHEMENEMIVDERQLKRSEEEIDAEFDQHNVDVEEILARTQRSFTSHRRRHVQLYEGKLRPYAKSLITEQFN